MYENLITGVKQQLHQKLHQYKQHKNEHQEWDWNNLVTIKQHLTQKWL